MNGCTISAVAAIAVALSACAGRTAEPGGRETTPRASIAELWIEPDPGRDLFWGVGGQRDAPDPSAPYAFLASDDSGFSDGYDVRGPGRIEWSAKLGPEAQPEVVVSRILWGIGYHQPPVYYLPSWTLARDGRRETIGPARFRPTLPGVERLEEPWRWQDNPFLGTREFRGLLVVLLMLNSTDLKDDNNSVYALREPWDGAARWFVVRDLGAALGETGRFRPRRNWLEGFEAQAFITRVNGASIEFDYDGLQQELLSRITADDVRWAADRMARLTEAQWQDAFRAADYTPEVAGRYIRRIARKVEDGLALRVDAAVQGER